jgi:hypothetical protein
MSKQFQFQAASGKSIATKSFSALPQADSFLMVLPEIFGRIFE